MTNKKLKNEWYYLWTLYKIPLIGVAVLILIIGGFIISALKEKENRLEVMLIDSFASYSDEEMEAEYIRSNLTDASKWDILTMGSLFFSGTESGSYAMNSLSRFMADLGSEKLDVCGMEKTSFIKYQKSGSFLDLSSYLTKEELERFQGKFLITEDGKKIGIYASALPRLSKWGCYENTENPGVIGIIYNSKHKEEAKRYLIEFLGTEG